tara:strand:+ start:948 stop:1370 length:423 start_codon:yes stop_codon:yes gene_type:complete
MHPLPTLPPKTNGLLIRTNGAIEPWAVYSLEEAAWIIGGEPAHLPVDKRFGLMLMVVADGEQRLPLNQTANMWFMRYDIWPGLSESLHGDILLHVDPDMPDVPNLQDVFEMLPRFGSAPCRVDWQAEAPRAAIIQEWNPF